SRWCLRSPRLEPSATATRTALFNPACGKNFSYQRADVVSSSSQQIVPARERLLKEPLLLQCFTENHVEHLAMTGALHACHSWTPAFDEGLGFARVPFDDRAHRVECLSACSVRTRCRHISAQRDDRLRHPRQLRFFAIDDVLVGVIGVVVADDARP